MIKIPRVGAFAVGLWLALVVAAMLADSPCCSEIACAQEPVNEAHSLSNLDKDRLNSFFDEKVPELLDQYHIPGATIALVKDGQPLMLRGYGISNVQGRTPVDAESTMFRIASVTKLFTWTVVMQLVEQGKLDLDEDINQYLTEFQIPATFPKPITVSHLMSHTAGFEDRGLIGSLAKSPDSVASLQDYLANQIPARIRPAGEISAYSNYGGALAGHIVANVAGVSYEKYVQQMIIEPLGMTHATARQVQTENMAVGYEWNQGSFLAQPFAYVIPTPEGGISASASSMARFMIAHLEGGGSDGSVILKPETIRQMHSQSFTHHPRINGWAHGFEENTINDLRILQHGGRLGHFTNSLVLAPSQRLGLFVSFNSHGGSIAGRELREEFFDEFFPATDSPSNQLETTPSSDLLKDSFYVAPCRRSRTTIAKLGTLMQSLPVKSDGKDTIDFMGERWTAIGDDLFQDESSRNKIAIRRDTKGRIEYLFIDTYAWQRLPWYQQPLFQVTVLGFCLVVFLGTLAVSGYRFIRKRKPESESGSLTRLQWVAQAIGVTCSTVSLFFIGCLVLILSGDTSTLEFGVPMSLRLLLVLPLINVVLALLMLVFLVVALRQHWWSRFARCSYTVLTIATFLIVWFLGFWNLLGWHY